MLTDAELIGAVRSGDLDSFGELFSRHRDAATRLARQLVPGPDADDLVAESFSRVMSALQKGNGPDEFFRAYLLTSIRRLHIDKIRAGKRLRTTDDESELDRAVEFIDPAEMKFEQQAAATAFASLPERWQMVLWHLDVEQQKPAQVAPLLGMTPNGVSALAYRAREGLRVAYLQSHLAPALDEACKTTTPLLGQYVRKALRARDTAAVEAHLDTCSRCSGLYLELVEVNGDLSGLLAPAILGTAAAGYLGTAGALASAGTALAALPGKLQTAASNSPATVAAAGVATLAVVASAVGVGIVAANNDDAPPTAAAPPAPQTPGTTPADPPPASSDQPTTPKSETVTQEAPPSIPTAPFVPAPTVPAPIPTTKAPEPAKPSPTPRPTPTPTPSPTPTPTPTPTEPEPVPTDYAVTLTTFNEPFILQRHVSVQVTATGDTPTNAQLSVSFAITPSTGIPTYVGGQSPAWSCASGNLTPGEDITTLTCTRLQTGSDIPPLEFSFYSWRPTITASLNVAGHTDPTPDNNIATGDPGSHPITP